MKPSGLTSFPGPRLLAVVCGFLLGTEAIAREPFTSVVVFGDSLSDTGRLLELTGVFPAPPTYDLGRESNGPLWHEYLSERLGIANVINYAVAGAMTAPAPGYPTGNVYSDTFAGLEGTDVTSQVQDYLLDVGGVADPGALYILQGGSNDLPNVADPSVIVQNLAQLVALLQESGARHILVMNLPDLGQTPRVILGEATGVFPPGTGAFVSALTALLNDALAATLQSIVAPGVTLALGDAFAIINRVAATPGDYGIVNAQHPYLLFGLGTDPATWLFWDDLHPTTRGHEILADEILVDFLGAYSPRNPRAGPAPVQSLRGLSIGTPRK